jgi:hypothetical protein
MTPDTRPDQRVPQHLRWSRQCCGVQVTSKERSHPSTACPSCSRPCLLQSRMPYPLEGAWNGSWNGGAGNPSVLGAAGAFSCGIGAGSGPKAREHASCKRQVSGSNPLTGSSSETLSGVGGSGCCRRVTGPLGRGGVGSRQCGGLRVLRVHRPPGSLAGRAGRAGTGLPARPLLRQRRRRRGSRQ